MIRGGLFSKGPLKVRLVELALDDVRPGEGQARQVFDEDELAELAASIKEVGLLQPILVRRRQDTYELIAGERRWRAARLAGLTHLPAVVQDGGDDEAMARGLIENIQRKELLPLEEASGLKALLDLTGSTQEALAKRLGMSQSGLANKLRLLKLAPATRAIAAEERDVLTSRHLRALLGVDDEEVQARLAREAARAGWTVKETERRIQGALAERHPKGRRRGVVRDVRIVLNTFRQAVATLVEGGLAAEMTQEESGDALTITVRIPNHRTPGGA